MVTGEAPVMQSPVSGYPEMFQTIVDNIPAMIMVYDGSGNPLLLNREFTRLLGWTLEEARKVDLMAECYPDPSERREVWKFMAGSVPGWREFTVRARDGRTFRCSWANVHLPDGSLIGIGIDVSERERLDEEVAAYRAHQEKMVEQRLSRLRESEERFRTLADQMPLAVYETDEQGRFSYMNRHGLDLFGYTEEAVRGGLTFFDLIGHADRDRARENFRKRVTEGSTKAEECLWIREDGTTFPGVACSALFRRNGRVAGVGGMLMDLSDLRQAERELLGSQKYEMVGRIAGGIAHHLNNLMTVVAGYGTLIVDRMDVRDPWRRQVEEMRSAGERAAALTAQLLAYSRRQILRPERIDLERFLSETESAIRREAGPKTVVSILPDAGAGAVYVDPEVLRNALLRLVENSREAMPEGGTLTVFSRRADLSGEDGPPVPAGNYAMIAVTDTGMGMDSEIRSQVFEPFFTTKEPAKGAGLSLSSVYGFVKQSKGYIFAESAPGKGTTIAIYLPQAEGDAKASGSG
jgi:two-component system cell cycle sensor histidine kinase/response regulator CckA